MSMLGEYWMRGVPDWLGPGLEDWMRGVPDWLGPGLEDWMGVGG